MNALPRFNARWVCLVFLSVCQYGHTQQCSREALTAKYWQYRENLNKHFVMNDRKPEGCVGNGITRTEEDNNDLNCGTDLLHGYGIPATSIIMDLDGGRTGMGDRTDEGSIFFDKGCADAGPSPGFTFDHEGPRKFNHLEYGSETPHQIGWYLITLATEYALLGQQGQIQEQQRTLEEIFLALQAYRRLDISANCLVKNRYDEITAGTEVCDGEIWEEDDESCLCPERYHNGQCPGDNSWHFDIHCLTNCPWSPDLSGYSGFFIREDATQEQEALHDPSEDKWNIDLVGGAFAMSQIPPCEDNFSPACYMERHTGYMSSDQAYLIMMGLAMVKRYIPETASIQTCEGEVYHPLDIAQDIAKGLVELPQNTYRKIYWPGSDDSDCCNHSIQFNSCAGGDYQFLYAGLEYMYNYIDPENKHKVGGLDRAKFGLVASGQLNSSNGVFVQEALSVGFDLATYGSRHARNRIIDACLTRNKEIFLLMNDLLYPALPNVVDTEALKTMFERMLCDAPCSGVCAKSITYDPNNSEGNWPEFDCANTPGWTGQRWEGPGGAANWFNPLTGRQFNGLDFMALYNMYMLHFPEEQPPFYNPARPEPIASGHLLGEDKINGPTILCPGQTGVYTLQSSYPAPSTLQAISWESSSNITLSSKSSNPTDATLITAQTPSHVGVSFQETNQKLAHHWGVPLTILLGNAGLDPNDPVFRVADVCDLSYRKPILTQTPNYNIDLDIDECQWLFQAIADGPALVDGVTLSWIATDNITGLTTTSNEMVIDFISIMPTELGMTGSVTITLVIQSACGNITKTVVAHYEICPDPYQQRQIIINPNPTNNQVSIYIIKNQSQDFITTDPNGVRIRIYPTSGGTSTLLDSYLYTNGQYFNVSSLPNGVYQVRATAADLAPIQTNLSIIH